MERGQRDNEREEEIKERETEWGSGRGRVQKGLNATAAT